MNFRLRTLVASLVSVVILGIAIISAGHHHVLTTTPNSPPSHTNITTTVFWIGETASSDNGHISNTPSAWDEQWQQHFGGIDDPQHRAGYHPATFTPRENPFYVALPYNDIDNRGVRKATAAPCRTYQPHYDAHYSVCKNIWVAVRHGNSIAFAQWEDAGPFGEDDAAYVFGSALPSNTLNQHAGLDVSPSLRDYLRLQDIDHTTWWFVAPENVPDGPWTKTVTTSPGESLQ